MVDKVLSAEEECSKLLDQVRLKRDLQAAYDELRQVVSMTIQREGKVIIPAFAVGRTQELVYDLQRVFTSGEIPRVPVYVDSPLAVNVSQVFRAHLDCYDEETQQFVRQNHHQRLLGFDLLTYPRSVEESKALNDRKDPMIIISASGMAETGRILHHLKNNIENPRNTVLIVVLSNWAFRSLFYKVLWNSCYSTSPKGN